MKWKILNKHPKFKIKDQKKLEQKLQLILLQNRGIRTKLEQKQFLNPSLKLLEQNFFDKQQLRKAIERIERAIKNNEQIIVYSDYDADGITAGTIVWETLDKLNARVMPYVPNRIDEGYGLSQKGIDAICKEYPDASLIITVDHGITAVNQIAYANKKGIDVIITDHHTIGKETPSAYAILHTTALSAAGIGYVFTQHIGEKFPQRTTIVSNKDEYLALSAIGTIADLVPLVGPNRVIAKYGLAAILKTKRPGLIALIEEAGLSKKPIGTYEIAFMIAPRLNATGRLTHALDSLRLLCTKSISRARKLAYVLGETNTSRQLMTQQSTDHAKSVVIEGKKIIMVTSESYHEGVIGLVAGKLVEKFYRPAIVIHKGETVSKASARSITGFNIIDAIRTCSDILINAGGHPMAAGFSIETRHLTLFQERIEKMADKFITPDLLEKIVTIDMELPFFMISKKLYEELLKFAPFGMANPEPVFMTSGVSIVSALPVGTDGKHLRFVLEKEGITHEAIGFGMGNRYNQLSFGKTFDIVYSLSMNYWNNHETVQLRIKDFRNT